MTNTSSFCTDLIFTRTTSLITEFGIEKSLYKDRCHHSVVFGKMNLNVPLPPPYTREVYNKADRKNKQRSLTSCNWTRLFINFTITERVELLLNKLINILRNYIPHKRLNLHM